MYECIESILFWNKIKIWDWEVKEETIGSKKRWIWPQNTSGRLAVCV